MDFLQTLTLRYHLPTHCAQPLMTSAERLEVDRKTLIAAEGQRDEWVYFVERGAVRTYVMREDRCVIISFSFEGDCASLAPARDTQGLLRCQIESIEASTIIRIPRTRLEELFAAYPELADWGRRMAEERLRLYEEYFADYAWMEKSEQYRYLLREYPQLLQRVPLKDLASYLYVTPQTLSRIRAELARE